MLAETVMLWDIDGTLLRSHGFGLRAFTTAIERATGAAWTPQPIDLGGRTDRDIAALILGTMGIDDPALVPVVLDALIEAYVELAEELSAAVEVLPGVVAALDAFAHHGALQTLVTGNVLPAATAKVTAAGLAGHLQIDLGGYGSDEHQVRADLVQRAIRRITATGRDVDPSRVWVVGDTPRDLECARVTGVRCALVATGTHPLEELTRLGADLVLADLADAGPLLAAAHG